MLLLLLLSIILPISPSPVSTRWGLPDAGATVGKLFLYSIPGDAFSGQIASYEVIEAGSEDLPLWLHWDPKSRQLLGVPSELDLGPHYISVTAVGRAINVTHVSIAKDVFSIHVREETPTSAKKLPTLEIQSSVQDVSCSADQPVISLSLLLDLDADLMVPLERASLLEQAARALQLPVERLRLYPLHYEHAQNRELLMAGPGESSGQRERGAYVLWRIACGVTVPESVAHQVTDVELKASSGTLAAQIGFPILSWQVSTGKIVPRKRRRQSGAVTPTPTFSPTPFTRTIDIDTRPITTAPQPTRTWGPIVPTVTLEESKAPVTVTAQPTTKRTTTTRRTTPRILTTETPDLPPTRRPGDTKPEVVKSLSSFTCYRGVVCKHRIPRETFSDEEDGDTYSLTLRLEPLDETRTNWMFLDNRQKHILGFIMEGGSWHYRLTATDTNGQSASTAFRVQVLEEETEEFSHQFTMRLKKDYKEVSSNASYQVHFLHRLATAIGDSEASAISVTDIRAGSTVVTWSNNTLSTESCSRNHISRIRGRMVTQSGQLRTDFIEHMGNQYAVNKVSLDYQGVCMVQSTGPPPITKAPIPSPSPSDPKSNTSSPVISDDLLISTIVPIVIIVLLLLVAILIACILYRRNRNKKDKLSKEGKSEFVSKGMPVVFPEEMEQEKEALNATAPMLVKEERPPLPVPEGEYQNGHSRTPARVGEESSPLLLQGQSTHENPLYKPPPPIEMSSTRSPRPKHTLPHQREPPPYVPP